MARNWYDSVVPEDAAPAPCEIDVSVAHPARVYDYWLGGKDNFAADRAAAQAGLEAFPDVVKSVRANRAFLGRAVRYLAAEVGIRQFLDIGTGLPSANNTHEVAQDVAPEARVVYVDNDPIVLLHAQALLTGTDQGQTDYIDADLRDTGKILQEAERTLDFTQPIAVMLLGILHFIPDSDDPYGIAAQLMAAVPPGSHVTISHIAKDINPEAMAEFGRRMDEQPSTRGEQRTHAEVSRFFDGLELLEPGVVPVSKWRPDSDIEAATPTMLWGGVARKPM